MMLRNEARLSCQEAGQLRWLISIKTALPSQVSYLSWQILDEQFCLTQSNSSLPLQFRRDTRDNEVVTPKFIESGGLPLLKPHPSPGSSLAALLSPPRQHLQPRHHPRLQLLTHHQRADPPRFNNHLKLPFHKQGKLLEADRGGLHFREGIWCVQQAAGRRRNSPWLGLCQWELVWRGGGDGGEGRRKSEGYFSTAPP